MNEVKKQIAEALSKSNRAPAKATAPAPENSSGEDNYIYSSAGKYISTETGVYLIKPDRDGTEKTIRVTHQRLDVIAIGRTAKNQGYSSLLEWEDIDGNTHQEIISQADLEGEAKDVRRMLADGGLRLKSKSGSIDYLIDYLRSCAPDRRFIIVDRLGWHKNKDGKLFFALKIRLSDSLKRKLSLIPRRRMKPYQRWKFPARPKNGVTMWQTFVTTPPGQRSEFVWPSPLLWLDYWTCQPSAYTSKAKPAAVNLL